MRNLLLTFAGLLASNAFLFASASLRLDDPPRPVIIKDVKTNPFPPIRPRAIGTPVIVVDDEWGEIMVSAPEESGLSRLIIQNLYTGETRVYEVSSGRDSVPVPNEPGVWMISIEQNGIVLQNEVLFL